MSFLKHEDHHTLLYIKVSPNASRTKIGEKFCDEKNQEWLKVSIAAVPQDGEANEELIRFLSKFLKISKSEIEIIRGETSRMKVVAIKAKLNDQFKKQC